MLRILLLNGENVQVVCFSKALKKIGCKVDAICSTRLSSGFATRNLSKRYIAPPLTGDVDAYGAYLKRHLKQHKYDLVIPMGDESAAFLSLNKKILEQMYGCSVAIPSYPKFERANDKAKLMGICRDYGIPHPRTQEINLENIEEAAKYVGFPAMIKPNVAAGAQGIQKVNNISELREFLLPILGTFGASTLQEYVEQPSYYYNVMLYRNAKGAIIGQTVIKIRRYFPLKGGSSCYSETVFKPELIEECSKLLQILDWEGFADFDVLEDKHTGDLKIIEINPRVPSSLQASFAAGVNFAQIYLDDFLGKPYKEYEYIEGQQVRWFGLDVMWLLTSSERFSFKPSWFKLIGKRVSYHDGTWKDPMPMLVGCLSGLRKYLNPSFRKAKLNK